MKQLALNFDPFLGSPAPAGKPPIEASARAPSPQASPSPEASPSSASPEASLASPPDAPSPLDAVRQARRISDRLTELLAEPVRLVITDNKRLMISARAHLGRFEIRLHHMFLDSDERVVRALAGYLKRRDKRSGRILDQFIATHDHRIDKRRRRAPSVRARGEVHDLKALFLVLVPRFEESMEGVRIGWGRHAPVRRSRRRSVQLGSYSTEDQLIRIHPVLDQDWVPEWYVSSVIFHEMLHHAIPPKRVGRTMRHHTAEFRRREASHEHHQDSLRWEERHLGRLLRSMART